jgi:SAM-dependent methyltransferase
MTASDDEFACVACSRRYPFVAGMIDFRPASDRYLPLDAERAKAERLASIAATTDLRGVAEAYYAMTPDPDPARCRRFLSHILSGERRGERLAARLGDPGRVLEVGCGTGGLLLAGSRRGWEITGVDIAARWLVVARRRLDDAGRCAELVAASVEALPWDDASFDTVAADSLVEHLDDPRIALGECLRVLRPGGRLLLWSPNRFTATTDPHVRLWGVGFLPRGWAELYVRRRRGGAWLPKCLGLSGARRVARETGFTDVHVGLPRLFAQEDKRLLARIYRGMSGFKAVEYAASPATPLWELNAWKARAQ